MFVLVALNTNYFTNNVHNWNIIYYVLKIKKYFIQERFITTQNVHNWTIWSTHVYHIFQKKKTLTILKHYKSLFYNKIYLKII